MTTPQDAIDRHTLIADWYGAYSTPLFRYLLRLVGDTERAADLLHDTFERAFNALRSQPPPDNASAWLHRIAAHAAYDALRRERRWRWLALGDHEVASAFESGVATAASVRACLARLKPPEAEALLLYEYAGLSCIEIGKLTGKDAATVRVQIHRARVRFRELYGKELA
jgi:RNA polymerase sigma-70 factor, ECF subfamily